MVLLSLLLILTACSGDDKGTEPKKDYAPKKEEVSTVDKEKKEELAEKTTAKDGDLYFDGKVAQTEKVKVEIQDTKVILAGEAGNEQGEKPVFAIWYEVTNLSDEETDSTSGWSDVFEVIQDNPDNLVNTLNTGQLPDDAHAASVLNKIKKGEKIESSISFELDEAEIPVTLIAVNGLLGDEIGRHDYPIK